jgi:photosystem II stability/assembly factor-like uncharacterized protein
MAPPIDIDPQSQEHPHAGMWYFDRKQWTFRSGDENGGVYRSIDGGLTWKRMTTGLPKLMGRLGIKVAASSPNVVYVVAETREGYVFRSDDHGETWRKVSDNAHTLGRGFYYADLRVDPQNPDRVYTLGMAYMLSIDGGKTFASMTGNFHGDFHTMWIDPLNPKRLLMGDDGGMNVSYDQGKSWGRFRYPRQQFYQLSADMREPFYHVAGGLQDNGVWTGPSRVRSGAILSRDWRFIQNGDGYYAVSHPDDPELFLSDYQAGGIQATNMRTYEQREASPQVKRMDGYPADSNKVRFNWNAPIVQSPHDRKVVYFAGNVVYRSSDWGKTWSAISGDLSTNDKSRLGDAGGPILKENTVAEYYGTVYSFAESPVQAGVLWAGTDDGNLQVSRDAGRTRTNVAPGVPGVGADAVVSGVEPSRTAAGTAYAAFERRMSDDFRPYLYRTTDFGRTWTNITGNLPPANWVEVVREIEDPNLIYAGTELGLHVSWTGGTRWTRLHLKNLPSVAVHEILIHPRENDLILATHGRSVWILDDAAPIQQMTPAIASRPAQLFPMRVATRFNTGDQSWDWGNKQYRGANTPYGALITYWLGAKPAADSLVKVEILKDGTVIRTLKRPSAGQGFNRMTWDLRMDPPKFLTDMNPDSAEAGDWRARPVGPQVLPGQYAVRLTVSGQSQEQPLSVRIDPTAQVSVAELQAQFDQATRLFNVVSTMIEVERNLGSFKNQVDERSSTARELRGDAARDWRGIR